MTPTVSARMSRAHQARGGGSNGSRARLVIGPSGPGIVWSARARRRSARRSHGKDRVACGKLVGGAKGLHEGDERRHLGRRQVLSIGRHVPAALQHLADQLISRQARGDVIERGAATAAFATETMAVAALLVL